VKIVNEYTVSGTRGEEGGARKRGETLGDPGGEKGRRGMEGKREQLERFEGL